MQTTSYTTLVQAVIITQTTSYYAGSNYYADDFFMQTTSYTTLIKAALLAERLEKILSCPCLAKPNAKRTCQKQTSTLRAGSAWP